MFGSILIFLILGLYYWLKGDSELIKIEAKIIAYPLIFLLVCGAIFNFPKLVIMFVFFIGIIVFSIVHHFDSKKTINIINEDTFEIQKEIQQTVPSIQEQEKIREREKALISAREEYEHLKSTLSECLSVKTYSPIDGNAIIIYTYIPQSSMSEYICDNGHSVNKYHKTGVTRYYPKNEYTWNIYFTELKRLCNIDEISIRPVIHCDLYNMENTFPVTTISKEMAMYCGDRIQYKCTIKLPGND